MSPEIVLIAHMLVTWCDDFPRSPIGLFCVGPERYVWNYGESTAPPLSATDALLRAHNVTVTIVQRPAVKPEPPPEPPGLRQGVRTSRR